LRTECKLTLKGLPKVRLDKKTDDDFNFSEIKNSSLQELVSAARFPQNRSPLTLNF
jgi:hypothetical protein